MTSSILLTPNQKRRQELRIWLYRNRLTIRELAQTLGVAEGYIGNLFGRDTMPTRHHVKLLESFPSLPVELLPRPADVPPGPRPKGLEAEAFDLIQA